MKIIDKRCKLEDRRHGLDTPKIPFRDNYGVTIIYDRRNTPDRRINNIKAEWIEESVIS